MRSVPQRLAATLRALLDDTYASDAADVDAADADADAVDADAADADAADADAIDAAYAEASQGADADVSGCRLCGECRDIGRPHRRRRT